MLISLSLQHISMLKPTALNSLPKKIVKQAGLELTTQLRDKEVLLGKIGTSQITRNAIIKKESLRKELLLFS